MRAFADTYFFLAALNARDPDHERAHNYFARDDLELVTTGFVLSEVDRRCRPEPLAPSSSSSTANCATIPLSRLSQ